MFSFLTGAFSFFSIVKLVLGLAMPGMIAGTCAYLLSRSLGGIGGLFLAVIVGGFITLGANTYFGKSCATRINELAQQYQAAVNEAAQKAAEHERQAYEDVKKQSEEMEQRAVDEALDLQAKVDALEKQVNESTVDCPVAATKDQMKLIEGIK